MSVKAGILHDYDLMANQEPAARKHTVCPVCDAIPVRYQWSDYSGEAMCIDCGTPFQLKWGNEKQRDEGNYPYLNLADDWVPIVRAYYAETKRFTCLGMMLGDKPGMFEFVQWLKVHHPDRVEKRE